MITSVRVKNIINNHKTVITNYCFMTIIKFVNSFFYLLVYPFLIRKLGAESYGLFVFATSIITYFQTFISFGFDFPAVKIISTEPDNREMKSSIVSSVLTAKIYLAAISLIIFIILVSQFDFFRKDWILYLICYSNIITTILLPVWYFQGMQKMKFITIAQVATKILSLPFIFLFVTAPSDTWIVALIISVSGCISGLYTLYLLIIKEKIIIRWQAFSTIKKLFKDSVPFFFSSSASIIKQQFTIFIIGISFSMSDVAIYDLANKLVAVPMNFIAQINNALFPKVMKEYSKRYIKKIIYIEGLLSLTIIAGLAIFGKLIINIFAGADMLNAYPLMMILSIILPCWLLVGCFINFVYVPLGLYSYVTKSQVSALVIFMTVCLAGVYFVKEIAIIAFAVSLSGIFELAYNYYIIKKNKLLVK